VLKPEGWKRTTLADVADFRNGLNFVRGERGHSVKVVGVGDFQQHETLADFTETATVTITNEIGKDDLLQDDDLLFVRSNGNKALVGRCVLISGVKEPVTFSGFTIRARVKSSVVDHSYLSKLVRSPLFLEHLHRRGGGSSINNLSQEALAEFNFGLPPLPEQRKIAEILRTWDEALEKLTALRAEKERRLGALRTALLFGRLRLKGLRHNWAPTRLEAVTHELTKRNGAKGLGRDSVMGVTKAEGVVPMREQTIAADISRYKRLPPRAFAYNPMRINVGSIAMNEREDAVLVSPDYVVFACNADGLDPDYLDHLRKTSWWAHYINSGGSGSVRQRTYYADLAALKLPLPDLDEQKAIAAVLNTARADLIATEREIEAVTRQKRGLMQKLLTGEWRVATAEKDSTEAAE
jgi:type I restriction enzyme S subunit